MTDADDIREFDWDPRAPEVVDNHQAAHDAMRGRCPVAKSPTGWSVFKYEDVVRVAQDAETFSSGPSTLEELETTGTRRIPLNLDQPVHTTYRLMMTPYFSAARMRAFEPDSREIAVRILAPLLNSGTTDFVTGYADPYPVQSLCALLGWPAEDWRKIKEWTTETERAGFHQDDELAQRMDQAWRDYILGFVRARRESPREDITSWLLENEREGLPLDDAKMVNILRLLLHAGHGTTTASLSIVLYHLAAKPDVQARLRSEPVLIPAAIEEILRFDSPLLAMPRTVKKDVTLGGRALRKGERVSMMYLAANRDPDAFPHADQCLIERKPNRHLVFGTGIHLCLGMPLAKLELKIATEEMLARTAHFALSADADLRRNRYLGNSFRSLRLDVTAAA